MKVTTYFSVLWVLLMPVISSSCSGDRGSLKAVAEERQKKSDFQNLKKLVREGNYDEVVAQYCGNVLLVKGDLDAQPDLPIKNKRVMVKAMKAFFSELEVARYPARGVYFFDRRKELESRRSFDDMRIPEGEPGKRDFYTLILTWKQKGEIVISGLTLGVDYIGQIAE